MTSHFYLVLRLGMSGAVLLLPLYSFVECAGEALLACFFNCKGKDHPKTYHEVPDFEQIYSSTVSTTSALYGGGGPGSEVCIATGYGPDDPGIEYR